MPVAPSPDPGDGPGVGLDAREAFRRRLGVSDEVLARLDAYRALLVDASAQFNLIGPSVLPSFWTRHVLDSAQLLALAPGALSWVDIGAGAGFPGLVLAILLRDRPGVRIDLIESVAKRSRFLEQVAVKLGLPVVVHHVRAESIRLSPEVVTARACAPLSRLLGYAAPHLRDGAIGLFLKGRDAETELTQARAQWRLDAELLPSLSDHSGRIVKVTRLARA